MNGILYGVGVGPGDPSLLTLKAVEIIRGADLIAVPDAGGEKTALAIIADYAKGKEQMLCPMPMTKDREILEKNHDETTDMLCAQLKRGRSIAFITLGDPSIYSTYCYVHKKVQARGFTAKMVPGVPSFCAAAAALGIPLCEGAQPLHIIPASCTDVRESLALAGGKVLMKSGKSRAAVIETIGDAGLLDSAGMVECCTMKNERLYPNLKKAPKNSSYFSIIIVKENA